MQSEDARRYVLELYRHLLRREPGEAEREHWVGVLTGGLAADAAFRAFIASREYQSLHQVQPAFPDGHFHSPVVDPRTLGDRVAKERAAAAQGIPGVTLPLPAMAAFWQQHAELIRATPFPDARTADRRYFYDNPVFAYGDAIMLRAMLAAWQPQRVIEVGSGFSTACMLDSADELGLRFTLTCIDPQPDRLRRLLRAEDADRITLIDQPVQSVPLERFGELTERDVLFIDSTHVLKTGSDVHYELFHILPSLRSGVVVHFHDIHYPFEYPDDWIFERNFSWNESYALRAFLMYNEAFEMLFWNGCFAASCPGAVEETNADFLRNPGGSVWLRRR